MRAVLSFACFTAVAAVAAMACVSGGHGPTGSPNLDGGVYVGDGNLAGLQPETLACTGDTTACVSGTATSKSLPAAQRFVASLFPMFPIQGVSPVAEQEVAVDGTWAFSGVAPGAHYYVQIVGVYGTTSIPAMVGPVAVPTSGAPIAVTVEPVELDVVEGSTAGGPLELQSALAYVFDPATGAPSTGGDTVSILVGGTAVPLAWTQIVTGVYGYYAALPAGTAAQATYTLTTSVGGAAATSWSLTATAPAFTPSITAPAAGATVPAGQDLAVAWTAQPGADMEVPNVYTLPSGGSWTVENASQAPLASSVTQATIPGADVLAGPLLVDVSFLVGNCPATADGCVIAEAIASNQLTAQ
jgi:hypothetical protein